MSKDTSGQSFVSQTRSDTYPLIDPKKANLSGKYVFISGASKGIGRALAISYAQAGAAGLALGARSDLTSLEREVLEAAKKAGRKVPKVVSVELDVTDLASAEAAAKATESAFGKLDILINNAGYLAHFGRITEGDPKEWWKTWEVNIKGVYNLKRTLIPLLLKGQDKTIINVSSMGAHRIRPGASDYQPTKFVLCRLAEFACAEYADEGLLVYSIHPGGIMTELASNMPKNMHHILVDKVELAADTMVFLSAEKRDWLAGRYISANWDMEEFLGKKDEILQGDLLKVRLAL